MKYLLTLILLSNQLMAQVPAVANPKSAKQIDPKNEGARPLKKPTNYELVTLSFNSEAILLIKSCIIKFPEALKSRMGNTKEGTKFISLQQFFINNRGWISTLEVTDKQRRGEEPLSESKLKMIAASTNLIIATQDGNPVGFKPFQPK
jgi:hypothetical protein